MVNIEFVVASHDGITGLYCGVGTVTRATIIALHDISVRLKYFSDINLVISCITGYKNTDSYCFDKEILTEINGYCNKTSGNVLFFDDERPNGEWLYPNKWLKGSENAAFVLSEYWKSKKIDHRILLAYDITVAHLPYLIKEAIQDDVIAIWTPQSTAINQKRVETTRFEFEKEVIQKIIEKNIFVGVASEYAYKHLAQDYHIPDYLFIKNFVGVALNDISYSINEQTILQLLQKYNVPTNKKLIISMGRAVPEKRLDTILRIPENEINGIHRIIIAALYSKKGDIHVENETATKEIRKLANDFSNSITLIENFDRQLAIALLLWKNTKAVVIPSSAEPLGMLGLETRLLSGFYGGEAVLIIADTEGLSDHVINERTGFVFKNDIDSLTKTINTLLYKSNEDIVNIKSLSFEFLLSQYCMHTNMYELMCNLLPHIFNVHRKNNFCDFSFNTKSHILVKPDGYKKNILSEILNEIHNLNLNYKVLGRFKLSEKEVLCWGDFINNLPDKQEILNYLTSNYYIFIELEGLHPISKALSLKTKIRQKYSCGNLYNLVHCPDNLYHTIRERRLFIPLLNNN